MQVQLRLKLVSLQLKQLMRVLVLLQQLLKQVFLQPKRAKLQPVPQVHLAQLHPLQAQQPQQLPKQAKHLLAQPQLLVVQLRLLHKQALQLLKQEKPQRVQHQQVVQLRQLLLKQVMQAHQLVQLLLQLVMLLLQKLTLVIQLLALHLLNQRQKQQEIPLWQLLIRSMTDI